jgi:hypothetical protein
MFGSDPWRSDLTKKVGIRKTVVMKKNAYTKVPVLPETFYEKSNDSSFFPGYSQIWAVSRGQCLQIHAGAEHWKNYPGISGKL